MVKDLVCGKYVEPNKEEAPHTEYHGRTLFFCSQNCVKQFEADPQAFINKVELTHPPKVA